MASLLEKTLQLVLGGGQIDELSAANFDIPSTKPKVNNLNPLFEKKINK